MPTRNKQKYSYDERAALKIIFKSLIPLYAAIFAQQFLGIFVNLLDNFMLGQYAETAMSGATIANQIQTVMANIVFGVGTGVAALGSQYWGKGETAPIKKIFSVGLKIAFLIGAVFTVVMAVFPRQILGLMTNDQAILDEAVNYMSIIAFTYVIYAISNQLMISLQAIETAYVGTIMSGCTIVINFCLNYILIYGHFGAPQLGIKGAAYATLTSRCVELIVVLVYIFVKDKKLRLRPAELLGFNFEYLKDLMAVAAPVMLTGCSWGFGLAAQTTILGHMSAEAIGASSIAVTVSQVFLVFSYAASSAICVIMGKTVGAGNNRLIRPVVRCLQIFLLILGILIGLVEFLSRNVILGLYNVSPGTTELAGWFIIIMAITGIGSVYEYPVMGGIIAGGGNTAYQAIIDSTFMWLFIIPLSALSAFVFNWPPIVTFCCLKVDQILKCIPNAIYCNSYKWIRNRTRQN